MHVYIYAEDLGLISAQRAALVDGLKALAGNLDRPQPCERNHWRVRLDGGAVIFEADKERQTCHRTLYRAFPTSSG